MDDIIRMFNQAVKDNKAALDVSELRVFSGRWLNADVLKLQKKSWSSSQLHDNPFHGGIFFSIWLNEEDRQKGIFHYNVHALKIRNLPGYLIKSRVFADEFRAGFSGIKHEWQNVSVNYGPQTLMEGSIPFISNEFRSATESLIKKFIPLAGVIDELLQSKRIV